MHNLVVIINFRLSFNDVNCCQFKLTMEICSDFLTEYNTGFKPSFPKVHRERGISML